MHYPERKANRYAQSELYSANNSFFITICTKDRQLAFGEIDDEGAMNLSFEGKGVEETWITLDEFIGNIKLEEYVVMPNHFHGIITFLGKPFFKSSGNEIYLSHIIGRFKSKSLYLSKQNEDNIVSFQWQKSFHDHIIRNEHDMAKIKEYILNNSLQWKLDVLNPVNEKSYQDWVKNSQV
jgi:putative transposase